MGTTRLHGTSMFSFLRSESENVAHSVMTDSCDPTDYRTPAPLSMGFSRQEYWNGYPVASPGHLPDPGIELGSPALQADSLPAELPGKPTRI